MTHNMRIGKSNSLADKFRDEGNELLAENKYFDAMVRFF